MGSEFGNMVVEELFELVDTKMKTGQIRQETGAKVIVFHQTVEKLAISSSKEAHGSLPD